jgi:amino acid permease
MTNDELLPIIIRNDHDETTLLVDQQHLQQKHLYGNSNNQSQSQLHDDANETSKTSLPPTTKASLLSVVASMTKNIVGCGVLSLPSGLAQCANAPTALIAANLIIAVLGAVFAYFCYMIASLCDRTTDSSSGSSSYRAMWQQTLGRGSRIVSVANATKAALAELAYATILSDALQSLLASLQWRVPRGVCLLAVTAFAILPLLQIKDLNRLAPFSALGTAGVIGTAVAMAKRYLDGSYLAGGNYYADMESKYHPYFGKDDRSWTRAITPLICQTFESFIMHYNSARFYSELRDRSLPRFAIAVGLSFGISTLLFCAITTLGFLTFGGNSSSFILNNYSPHDPLATASRLAVGLSTLMAYPIVFLGVRDGVFDTLGVQEQTPEKVKLLTCVLLAMLTFVSFFVTDLGLINTVGGGLIATLIVFVFPALMFWASVKSRGIKLELVIAILLTIGGVAIGLIGVWTALFT